MYFVTGGTGFLGNKLIPELAKKKEVKAYVHHPHKADWMPKIGVQIKQGSVNDYPTLLKAMDGCSTVYHMAALVDYYLPYRTLYPVNVQGTENVLKAAEACDAKVVLVSSVAAETSDTAYGLSKAMAESVVPNYKCETIIVRPAPIYGVGSRFLYKLIDGVAKGKMGHIGNKSYNVHMLDYRNAIDGLLKAQKGKAGEAYVLADKKGMDSMKMFELVQKAVGAKPKTIPYWLASLYARFADLKFLLTKQKSSLNTAYLRTLMRDRHYNISKSVKELKYKPSISMRAGMTDVIKWYQSTLPEA